MENISANSQVTIVEVVDLGPSHGSELSSSENERVEHAKSEQQSLKLAKLVRLSSLEVALIEFGEGSSDVGLKILWSLIGNFKCILKNRLWDDFHVWKTWWFRGNEASEVWMSSILKHNLEVSLE